MICPVCDKEVELIYRDVLDGWCLMEEEYKCGNHYRYFYGTGSSEETIGKHIYAWTYCHDLNRFEKMSRKIVICLARRQYASD